MTRPQGPEKAALSLSPGYFNQGTFRGTSFPKVTSIHLGRLDAAGNTFRSNEKIVKHLLCVPQDGGCGFAGARAWVRRRAWLFS